MTLFMINLTPFISALVLFVQIASAQNFTVVRDIRLPLALSAPRSILVELDAEATAQPGLPFRIINSANTATATIRMDDLENILPQATFVSVPLAADTVPRTTVEMLRDSDLSTAFQPVTAETVTFLLRFASDVTPRVLEYEMESGTVEYATVRIGPDAESLRNAFVGTPSHNRIDLSGERARVFEVTLTIRQGVPKIREIFLLQPRSRLLFRAVPNQSYRLLYGAGEYVDGPHDNTLKDRDSVIATVGPGRRPSEAELGDHDGVNEADNCPLHWNPKQEDADGDGIGNVCDNCDVPNPDQTDENRNGAGDICEDPDGDGWINAEDNCPQVENYAQEDEDQDGRGNVCDNDDNRFSANKPWLLWTAMIMIILVLAGLGTAVMRRTKNP